MADGNADGKVSRTEWSKVVQSFSRLDADKDNAINAAELEATGGAAAILVELGDADSDGKNYACRVGEAFRNFARLDTNKDSSVDEAEFQTAADALSSRASGSASLPATDDKPTAAGPGVVRGDRGADRSSCW